MNRRLAPWWLAIASMAIAVKAHYRAADAADLSWILTPLALLLELASGHRFERLPSGEWQSAQAGIALVKGCAGINFMVMSLLAWGRSFAPRWRRVEGARASVVMLGALVASWICAWATALAANLLRIVVLDRVQPLLETWLSPIAAHRLCGLAVYLGVLTLQVAATERLALRPALAIAAAIQVGILVLVPLMSGHATLADPEFRALASSVLALFTLAGAAWSGWRKVNRISGSIEQISASVHHGGRALP